MLLGFLRHFCLCGCEPLQSCGWECTAYASTAQRFTRIWCWRHQAGQPHGQRSQWRWWMDRQTDRGRTGTPAAAQLPQPEGSRSSQVSLSVHTAKLRAWPKIPRFKLPRVFCHICDISLIQVITACLSMSLPLNPKALFSPFSAKSREKCLMPKSLTALRMG